MATIYTHRGPCFVLHRSVDFPLMMTVAYCSSPNPVQRRWRDDARTTKPARPLCCLCLFVSIVPQGLLSPGIPRPPGPSVYEHVVHVKKP